MRFRQLRYFATVARSGSFSKASAELHVAQPALSSQIAALEDELGVQLFLRHSRGIELTAAGRVLLARAQQILDLVELARSEVSGLQAVLQGEVRIGLPTTTAPVLALPLLDLGRQQLPRISFQIVEGMTGHLDRWLEQEDIDVAVLYGPPSGPRCGARPFAREGLMLIGPDCPRLARRRDVAFAEIASLPIIHTTRGHQLRRLLDAEALRTAVPLNVVSEIDSLAQLKMLVYTGKGYTILPEISATSDWVNGAIRCWPLRDSEPSLQVHVAWSPKFQRQPHFQATLDFLDMLARHTITTGCWKGARLAAIARAEAVVPE